MKHNTRSILKVFYVQYEHKLYELTNNIYQRLDENINQSANDHRLVKKKSGKFSCNFQQSLYHCHGINAVYYVFFRRNGM
jgi:hypothetical protein